MEARIATVGRTQQQRVYREDQAENFVLNATVLEERHYHHPLLVDDGHLHD